jgi:hypothetical protein
MARLFPDADSKPRPRTASRAARAGPSAPATRRPHDPGLAGRSKGSAPAWRPDHDEISDASAAPVVPPHLHACADLQVRPRPVSCADTVPRVVVRMIRPCTPPPADAGKRASRLINGDDGAASSCGPMIRGRIGGGRRCRDEGRGSGASEVKERTSGLHRVHPPGFASLVDFGASHDPRRVHGTYGGRMDRRPQGAPPGGQWVCARCLCANAR